MKIVSWNVNGIRACYKKNLKEFILKEAPDVLCLQEVKAHIDQVEAEAKMLNFKYSHWSSALRKGYSGVATFHNDEVKQVYTGIEQPEYTTEGRFVITEHQHFDLYNIYFPNGGSGPDRHEFKQKFLRDLYIHLKQKLLTGRQIVVVGDYNIAHSELDIYDPAKLATTSGFLPEERKWMTEFFELGFIDSFRSLFPSAKEKYSWWSYREFAKVGNRGWRIDYISVSHGLQKHLKHAHIFDDVEGSDHCPISVTLDL
jgi:exodeoxyribonuclease III